MGWQRILANSQGISNSRNKSGPWDFYCTLRLVTGYDFLFGESKYVVFLMERGKEAFSRRLEAV